MIRTKEVRLTRLEATIMHQRMLLPQKNRELQHQCHLLRVRTAIMAAEVVVAVVAVVAQQYQSPPLRTLQRDFVREESHS